MEMQSKLTRNPNLIAAEINDIRNRTGKIFIYNSIEIGKRLAEVKEILPHGEWGKWLKTSVKYSQRTADNLMRIFNEYGDQQMSLLDSNPNSQAFANLTYSKAVLLLDVAAEDREAFAVENDINNKSTKEVERLVKENKKLEKKVQEADKKFQSEISVIKDKSKEDLTNKEVEITNLNIYIKDLEKKIKKAEENKVDIEEVEKLQEAINTAQNEKQEREEKIQQLEEELKDKPIDVTETVIEKIPEETQKELEDLREKVNKNSDEAVLKYSMYFDLLTENFSNLLSNLAEIKSKDEVIYNQYKKATLSLINKMEENL